MNQPWIYMYSPSQSPLPPLHPIPLGLPSAPGASCRWQSEGLLGQYFFVALPVQTLRGLPCLESFSVVWPIRDIEHPLHPHPDGVLLWRSAHQALKWAPWVGSNSVVQCIRRLMGQPLLLGCWCPPMGEREAVVIAPPPTCDSAVTPCFHGCLAFFHRDFPPHHNHLPHIPLIHLFAVNRSPHPGIAPQSLNSSS